MGGWGPQGIVWVLKINRGQMHAGAGQTSDSWVVHLAFCVRKET